MCVPNGLQSVFRERVCVCVLRMGSKVVRMGSKVRYECVCVANGLRSELEVCVCVLPLVEDIIIDCLVPLGGQHDIHIARSGKKTITLFTSSPSSLTLVDDNVTLFHHSSMI